MYFSNYYIDMTVWHCFANFEFSEKYIQSMFYLDREGVSSQTVFQKFRLCICTVHTCLVGCSDLVLILDFTICWCFMNEISLF